MRILFLHKNFPAQFRHLAHAMGADVRHTVVFGTARAEGAIDGVQKGLFRENLKASPETHPATRPVEEAIRTGQDAYRLAANFRRMNFVPDVIYGHSGWGPTLFMKDLFPRAKLLCYFEWFYRTRSPLHSFDPESALSELAVFQNRVRNVPILTDLYTCDAGLSPTRWQRDQFPAEFRPKLHVLHDGVDTDYFLPAPVRPALVLPRIKLDLSRAADIVTYVARGMEPVRGFPQFIRMMAILQKRRPGCHAVIVGRDRIAYGEKRADGRSWKEAMLAETELDPARIHFTGLLPYHEYRRVLQASDAHVYLTWPFVLSWSVIEALATGCLVIASGTEPVREVIRDGENGLLVDFLDVEAMAGRVEAALENRDTVAPIRARARETVLENYALADLLPRHLAWIERALG